MSALSANLAPFSDDPFLDFVALVHEAHGIFHGCAALDDRQLKRLHKLTLRPQFAPHLGPGSWVRQARLAQLSPVDPAWNIWLMMAGRGFGKTRALTSTAHIAVAAGLKHLHLIGADWDEVRLLLIEGHDGVLATAPAGMRPAWSPSTNMLSWPNGARCQVFSGEDPESLRGPQCEFALIDELGKMPRQQDVFDQVSFGLRLGSHPRLMIATTPRPTKLMRALVTMKDVALTTGTTYDNAENLAPAFLNAMRDRYQGTRTGLQELHGKLLTIDPKEALFHEEWITIDAVNEDVIEQVSIGVDPSGGADAIGIVAVAGLVDGGYAVLADRTCKGSPAHWGATHVVRQAAERAASEEKRKDPYIRIREVNASRGKVMRAEPVSLLYEKGRVFHRLGLDLLEAEMLNFTRDWDRARNGSPNRLDAAVWALTLIQSGDGYSDCVTGAQRDDSLDLSIRQPRLLSATFSTSIREMMQRR